MPNTTSFNDLPDEIVLQILNQLRTVKDFMSIVSTCRRVHEVSFDSILPFLLLVPEQLESKIAQLHQAVKNSRADKKSASGIFCVGVGGTVGFGYTINSMISIMPDDMVSASVKFGYVVALLVSFGFGPVLIGRAARDFLCNNPPKEKLHALEQVREKHWEQLEREFREFDAAPLTYYENLAATARDEKGLKNQIYSLWNERKSTFQLGQEIKIDIPALDATLNNEPLPEISSVVAP